MQNPSLRPKKMVDNPFYALTLHKKFLNVKTPQVLPQEQKLAAFPKRKSKSKKRSQTLPDNQLVQFPEISTRQRSPKPIHIAFNLNFLIQEKKRLMW
ncbi:hypothetical protein pb186bvf_005863 [Paramecium bursaria]